MALAALREPELPRATLAGEERELRLLVDYRDQLVRDRDQQRIRWHLHELCPDLDVPSRALDRGPWPGRVTRRLRQMDPGVQVEIVSTQLKRMIQMTRQIDELEKPIASIVKTLAPNCWRSAASAAPPCSATARDGKPSPLDSGSGSVEGIG